MDPKANRLLRELSKQHIKQIAKARGRYIPPEIYNKLKALRKCQECGAEFSQPPYVHHIKPVCQGGESTEDNLKAVCYQCHQKLDQKAKQEPQIQIKDIELKKIITQCDQQLLNLQSTIEKIEPYLIQEQKFKIRNIQGSITGIKTQIKRITRTILQENNNKNE